MIKRKFTTKGGEKMTALESKSIIPEGHQPIKEVPDIPPDELSFLLDANMTHARFIDEGTILEVSRFNEGG